MRALRIAAGLTLLVMIVTAPIWPRPKAGWYRTITVFGHVVPIYRIDDGEDQ